MVVWRFGHLRNLWRSFQSSMWRKQSVPWGLLRFSRVGSRVESHWATCVVCRDVGTNLTGRLFSEGNRWSSDQKFVFDIFFLGVTLQMKKFHHYIFKTMIMQSFFWHTPFLEFSLVYMASKYQQTTIGAKGYGSISTLHPEPNPMTASLSCKISTYI